MTSLPASILSAEQQTRLQGLARELSAEQLSWASGYLAGVAAAASAQRSAPAPVLAGARRGPQVTVLYGSETGHARGLAERIGRMLAEKGIHGRVTSMGEYKPRNLRDERFLVIVTSTHGEGDPPEPARGLVEFLMGRKAPRLNGVRYAVLGLGDSSYEHFCKTAKDLDARLEQLGAERLRPRVDCDVDFSATASTWIDELIPRLETLAGRAESPFLVASTPAGAATAADPSGGVLSATVLEHIRLNGRGSSKATFHIEFGLADADVRHAPGDSLGVITENDPALVDELLDALGMAADQDLVRSLQTEYELTVLTPGFIDAYGNAGNIEALTKLVSGPGRGALRSYLCDRQIVDVVREYPLKGLSSAALRGMLRKLQPRLYSIASSASAAPGEIHITVSEVRYQSAFGSRSGVASGNLCSRAGEGASFQVFIERNDNFRLPEDPATPIIMIGAGTGVAPFRAFLQEREAQGARGKSWLFFGDRNFRTDFLYQTEWQQYLKDGLLTRMDVAFSRDQDRKAYVQNRLRERGREVFGWLQEGAYVYVCGDAKQMAPDVNAALIDIVATHGGWDTETAREYVNEMTLERRYRRDVY